MSFGLLSTFTVLLGIVLLAIGLWLLQRLRVQHREVTVLSTLFWQSAVEETRARVFVKRFRHWPAWVLLVAIASLLWMLLARPQSTSFDSTQHVVLIDRSVEDDEIRADDFELAIQRAASLPTSARQVIAVDNHLQTLLAAGEPTELASPRIDHDQASAPQGIQWAIETLSSRASDKEPLAIHVVGDAQVEQRFLDEIDDNVTVYRIDREGPPKEIRLATLGVADSASQQWNQVDVSIGFDPQQEVDSSQLAITLDGETYAGSLQKIAPSTFQLSGVAASGQVLSVLRNGQRLGSLTLPNRQPIRVSLDAGVPETLRELVQLDSACQIVANGADVRIGTTADANLRLSTDDQSAFLIESDDADPNATFAELIDTLALRQIDATAIANQSGSIVDVQVVPGVKRSVAIWQKLFTSSFDFQESRACPILVARAIRWIANRPPMVPWAQQGERLPVAAAPLDRAIRSTTTTGDGREVQTTRLAATVNHPAQLAASPAAGLLSQIGLPTWLGLLVSMLLVGEWVLYQRGRLP